MRIPGRRRRPRGADAEPAGPGLVSAADWRGRRVRWSMRARPGRDPVFLLIVGLGPLLWMVKSSITPTQDTLRTPMALWPNGFDLGNFATAWSRTHIDRYLLNTVWIAFGSWVVQIVVATTAGYALSVLRPRFRRVMLGAGPRDPVRAADRAARPAVPDRSSTCRSSTSG